MPGDNDQQANSGVSTQDPAVSTPNDNQVPVDRAELERLQQAEARIKKLDEIAAEAKCPNAEDYFDAMEQELYKSGGDENPANGAPSATKPQAPAAPASTPAAQAGGLSDADKRRLDESDMRSSASYVQSQRLEWQIEQNALPEDERSTATPEELLKMIRGPKSQIIGASAQAYGGNIFKAAAALYSLEHGVASARKAGAAAEKAKAAAAATANLDPGGTTAEPAAKTPEEKRAELNKQEADKIAPDDPPFDMTE